MALDILESLEMQWKLVFNTMQCNVSQNGIRIIFMSFLIYPSPETYPHVFYIIYRYSIPECRPHSIVHEGDIFLCIHTMNEKERWSLHIYF